MFGILLIVFSSLNFIVLILCFESCLLAFILIFLKYQITLIFIMVFFSRYMAGSRTSI